MPVTSIKYYNFIYVKNVFKKKKYKERRIGFELSYLSSQSCPINVIFDAYEICKLIVINRTNTIASKSRRSFARKSLILSPMSEEFL